jgi:hypothetical protein
MRAAGPTPSFGPRRPIFTASGGRPAEMAEMSRGASVDRARSVPETARGITAERIVGVILRRRCRRRHHRLSTIGSQQVGQRRGICLSSRIRLCVMRVPEVECRRVYNGRRVRRRRWEGGRRLTDQAGARSISRQLASRSPTIGMRPSRRRVSKVERVNHVGFESLDRCPTRASVYTAFCDEN